MMKTFTSTTPTSLPAIHSHKPDYLETCSVPAEEDVPALTTSVANSVASSEADEELPELGDEVALDQEDDEEEEPDPERDPATLHARAKEAATILLSQMLSDREEVSLPGIPSFEYTDCLAKPEYSSRWATPMSMSTYHLSRLGLEPLQLMLNVGSFIALAVTANLRVALLFQTPPSTIVPPSKATSVYCLDDDEDELPVSHTSTLCPFSS
jgi:hypothetical protein